MEAKLGKNAGDRRRLLVRELNPNPLPNHFGNLEKAGRLRHERVVRSRPMQFLRGKKLVETTADDFFHAISIGTNSTVPFLQTLHNDALGMGWIVCPPIDERNTWAEATPGMQN
jgi:hypothetical protein